MRMRAVLPRETRNGQFIDRSPGAVSRKCAKESIGLPVLSTYRRRRRPAQHGVGSIFTCVLDAQFAFGREVATCAVALDHRRYADDGFVWRDYRGCASERRVRSVYLPVYPR